MKLWGAHGTSAESAREIKKAGFLSGNGRVGNGAYFWTIIDESAECRELAGGLAYKWAEMARKRGAISSSSQLSVVYVEVDVSEDEVINLDEPALHYALWACLRRGLEEKLGVDVFSSALPDVKRMVRECESFIFGMIESFIREIEQELGVSFKVVFKFQQCPKFEDAFFPFIGGHSCFAVRAADAIVVKEVTGGGSDENSVRAVAV